MRPLSHPAIDDVPLGAILHALSDPVRAAIFAGIAGAGCVQTCQAFANVGERAIPIRQIMRAEAVEVWKKYQAKEDTVQY